MAGISIKEQSIKEIWHIANIKTLPKHTRFQNFPSPLCFSPLENTKFKCGLSELRNSKNFQSAVLKIPFLRSPTFNHNNLLLSKQRSNILIPSWFPSEPQAQNTKNIPLILVLRRRRKIEGEEESLKQIGCVERNYLHSDTKMNIYIFLVRVLF